MPIQEPVVKKEQSATRSRLDHNPTHSRGPERKSPKSIPRKPPAITGKVGAISATANIIALIEGRSGAWSAPELAELLGCTGKHIYALAKSGRMPHLRIGSMIRFDPAATADWLRERFVAA
jgi:excisionase family DNA binding protein